MAIALQEPRLEKRNAFLIAGAAERFTYDTMARIPLLWQRFAPFIGSVPGQVGYATYGVCRSDDDGFEYVAGVEVASLDGLPEGLRGLRLARQTYAVFAHSGHVSAIRNTMDAIWNSWLPASQLSAVDAPFFERYGDAFDPQTGSGSFEIWVPVVA